MAAATGDDPHPFIRGFEEDPSAPNVTRLQREPVTSDTRDLANQSFDPDGQIDDVFRDADTNEAGRDRGLPEIDQLGLDTEVQRRKPRVKQAKLDETRLLGPQGVPALRKITKSRLRFRGKGHEFSDVARLLSQYQLWLDDLFPKANFADGLAIIEKLGHTRRMQGMRRDWINEDKPKPADPIDLDVVEDRGLSPTREPSGNSSHSNGDMQLMSGANEGDYAKNNVDDARAATQPNLDGGALRELSSGAPVEGQAVPPRQEHGDVPEVDELDRLLAEEEEQDALQNPAARRTQEPDPELDEEMEAMLEMNMGW